jgi:hypothetical protein
MADLSGVGGPKIRGCVTDLPVVMVDGIHFRDRVLIVALGIDIGGEKHIC